MGITMIVAGRLGKPERPSFLSRRAHLLTTCPQGRRWYPSRWSGRALFTKCPPGTSPEGAANAAGCSFVIGCAAGRRLSPALHPPCPYPGQSAIRLRKPATGSFIAEMDDASRTVHFLLLAPKETKTPPCGEQIGRDYLWQSIILKQKS